MVTGAALAMAGPAAALLVFFVTATKAVDVSTA